MASVTINQELDSSFLRGLRLLHSSEPDAEEQLQQLWKQAVVDKYGSERIPTSVLHKITVPSALKRENQDTTSETAVETKRPKLENSVFAKPAASASPQPAASADVVEVQQNGNSNEDSDNDSPLEILNVEGTCMKCKASTSSADNKLVECVDCHKHYHQLCHFPPITDMDLNDPRFVWYCSSCDQSITTTTLTSSDKSKTSSSSSTSAAVKSSSSSKGTSVTTKSGRVSSSSSSKSSTQGSANSTSSKSSEPSSKENSSSSSSTEKKGHMMKKRSMNKPDKKKSK